MAVDTTVAPAPLASRLDFGRARIAEAGPPAGAGLLILLVGAASGGYFPTTWGWTGVIIALVTALALLFARTRVGPFELAAVGLLAGYVAWVALTRLWSDAPGHTLLEVQRDLIYPLALLSALLLVRRSAVGLLIGAVAIAVDALALYGLLTRLLPERLGTFDSVAAYRLSAPVGYWNALGIVTAMGIVLTFGVTARGRAAARVVAAAVLVGLGPTLYFTFSRGAVVALGIGLLALVVADTRRLQLMLVAGVVAPLPIAATSVATRYSALTTTAAPLSAATHDGHRLALVIVGFAAVSALLATCLVLAERHIRPGPRLSYAWGIVVVAAATALAVAVIAHFGGPVTMVRDAYDSFHGPPVGSTAAGSNLTNRFTTLSSNGRIDLWRGAWHDFQRSRLVGSGAGEFEWYWAQHQPYAGKARDAHSLYVETLAEMGVVGLVFIVLALVAPFGAFLRARRQPLIPFVAGAYVAFLAHIGVDWDWEMPVVILTGLFLAAAILIAGRRDEATVELSMPVRVATLVVILAAGVLAFMGLISSNALVAGRTADANGKFAAAERDAREAATWAPWSSEPWKQLAEVQRRLGDLRGTRASLRKAIELEPQDYAAWLALGNVSTGREQRRAFSKARRLYPNNPLNPQPTPSSG